MKKQGQLQGRKNKGIIDIIFPHHRRWGKFFDIKIYILREKEKWKKVIRKWRVKDVKLITVQGQMCKYYIKGGQNYVRSSR